MKRLICRLIGHSFICLFRRPLLKPPNIIPESDLTIWECQRCGLMMEREQRPQATAKATDDYVGGAR